MNHNDIDKAYVSPYDQLLHTFDATHPKTASQQKEIKKNKRIATQRDHANPLPTDEAIWSEF